MMVLWHTLAVLSEVFSITPIVIDGWSPRSPDLSPLDLYLWGHQKSLVYSAPVDNEETFHHRIADACQTIHSYPAVFERMRRSMMRRVEA
jgi:hypothetical protein